jgi:hypothetical protein
MASKKKLVVFPEEKETVSKDTEVTIGSILESYSERGKQFSSEGIHYSPITLITEISNLYLIKKYNTNCFMYGDTRNEQNIMYGGFVLNFLQSQLDLPIERIVPDMLAQINNKNFLLQIDNFLNCIKNMKPVIFIPLLLNFTDGTPHANMLIYRKDLNIIEHFEPHGAFFDSKEDYGGKINIILQFVIYKINEINNTPTSRFYNVLSSNIHLITSDKICLRSGGLQSIQSLLASFSIEGAGYCQMWSLLFAELALLNPTISSIEILENIYGLLETQDGPLFLSNIIRGYVSMLGDEISVYLSEYINNVFTIENIGYICKIYPDYARYLSDIINYIVHTEINIENLFQSSLKTMVQLNTVEAGLQGSLSKYFRLQNELKELLINRKQNYSIRGVESVDSEIASKLSEELLEYASKRREVRNYVQNKIFQKYLRNKQELVMATEKKPKATKAPANNSVKKVEEVIVKEAPKKGRKKVEPIIEEKEEVIIPPPIPPVVSIVEETNTNQRKSTRNTKKGGKKYIKRTKKYKKRKLKNTKKIK